MNTPSHFLVGAGLAKAFGRKVGMVKPAFLLGSVMPDLPLYVLSIAGIIYYHTIKGWSLRATFERLYDQLYFHDPLWIVTHNFLHAPLILLSGILLCWYFQKPRHQLSEPPKEGYFRVNKACTWGFWFFWGCLLHTALDIPTHVDDGPLILFPLNWSLRFHSPVSYWDDRYYGREFATFEAVLDVGLIVYLISPWVWRRLKAFNQ